MLILRLLRSFRLYALLFIVLLSGCGGSHEFTATVLEPPNTAPDFSLVNQHGETFQLSEQQGSVVLLFFGFTSCPDICPGELAQLAAVRRELGSDAEQVQVAFVTLDPERDTPERLGWYVGNFDPTFYGLYGSPEELEPVLQDYGVTSIKRELEGSQLGYTIDHSAFLYAIDKAGNWRLLFPYGSNIDDIVADVRYLTRENVQ
jgi:protein SCO1/2